MFFLCGACVTEKHTTVTRYPTVPPPREIKDRHIIVDPSLDSVIKIVGIKTSTSADGYFKVQVNVQNKTSSLKSFNYRIDWLDKDGRNVPFASETLPWTLLSGETSFLAATAPTPIAADFRVTFFLGPSS